MTQNYYQDNRYIVLSAEEIHARAREDQLGDTGVNLGSPLPLNQPPFEPPFERSYLPGLSGYGWAYEPPQPLLRYLELGDHDGELYYNAFTPTPPLEETIPLWTPPHTESSMHHHFPGLGRCPLLLLDLNGPTTPGFSTEPTIYPTPAGNIKEIESPILDKRSPGGLDSGTPRSDKRSPKDLGPGTPYSDHRSPGDLGPRTPHSENLPEQDQSNATPATISSSRPFKCRVRSCGMTFKRRAELDRHRDSVHQQSSGFGFFCPVEGCNRNKENPFSRKDNLRQHLKLKHDYKFPKGRSARG